MDLSRQNLETTALSHLMQLEGWTDDEQEARGMLAKLSMRGNSESPVGNTIRGTASLSGKSSFDFPHLLVLNEVTAHLPHKHD